MKLKDSLATTVITQERKDIVAIQRQHVAEL